MATPVPAEFPNIGSFLPVCDIMFPEGVGSLRILGVSGVLKVSESQNHELYYSHMLGVTFLYISSSAKISKIKEQYVIAEITSGQP